MLINVYHLAEHFVSQGQFIAIRLKIVQFELSK